MPKSNASASKMSIHDPRHPHVLAARARANQPEPKRKTATYQIRAKIVSVKEGKLFFSDSGDGLPSSISVNLLPKNQRTKAKAGLVVIVGMNVDKAVSADLA